ncbi:hypothetical protein Agub_g5647, partial [Astrephomene gubernaculifera]
CRRLLLKHCRHVGPRHEPVCLLHSLNRQEARNSGQGIRFSSGFPGPSVRCSATNRAGNDLPQDWTQVVSWAREEFRRCISKPASFPSSPPAAAASSLHPAPSSAATATASPATTIASPTHASNTHLHDNYHHRYDDTNSYLQDAPEASSETSPSEQLDFDNDVDNADDNDNSNEAEEEDEEEADNDNNNEHQDDDAEEDDAWLPLAKCCLLVALEEEAAAAAEGAGLHPEIGELLGGMRQLRPRSAAGSSTWSGERLAALAAEVAGLLAEELSGAGQELQGGEELSGVTSSGSRREGHIGCSSSSSSSGSSTHPYGQCSSSNDSSSSNNNAAAAAADTNVQLPSCSPGELYRRYPMQTLAAVNTVLYDRHGYRPCNRYGVASDHRLSSVLEGGVGASAALSILYLEVCERLGFPLAARPLEEGRYFVLWPRDVSLTANGQRFLVDPYGRGGLLLAEEVSELFEVPPRLLLRPAPRRLLLAALLGELRDCHWASAAGCSAAPGSMVPLSVDTALGNKVSVPGSGVRAAALRRAVAAAEKRLWLLPEDSEAQLQYGLLLYFSRRYDDAWIELALYLERFGKGLLSTADPVSAVDNTSTKGHVTPVADMTLTTASREVEAGPPTAIQTVSTDEAVAAAAAVSEVVEPSAGEGVVGSGDASGRQPQGGEDVLTDGAKEETGRGDAKADQADAGGSQPSPSSSSACSISVPLGSKVAMLVERIRLELEFAPVRP